ncbi:blue light receptor [Pseudogymnoascus destructans]|uniref:Blue light receptor n=1 Tax=Pseudogymnoascus destructans TaxID=655981 RepID=A0A177A0D5_9PEZI|nr:blue light receptor [Pseudogymnoascus destructans]OAF54553.1 blue light receptor [Pseudogymnoascus destructans]
MPRPVSDALGPRRDSMFVSSPPLPDALSEFQPCILVTASTPSIREELSLSPRQSYCLPQLHLARYIAGLKRLSCGVGDHRRYRLRDFPDRRRPPHDATGSAMHEFFGPQYTREDRSQQQPQQQQQQSAQRRYPQNDIGSQAMGMAMLGPVCENEAMDMTNMSDLMGGGDTLDDIVRQNSKELLRRQSLPLQQFGGDMDDIYTPIQNRRGSMMEFGSGQAALNNFQFTSAASNASLLVQSRRPSMQGLEVPRGYGDIGIQSRRPSIQELEVAVGYGDINVHSRRPSIQELDVSRGYGDMGANMDMDMAGNPTNFSLMAQTSVAIESPTAYQALPPQGIPTNMMSDMMAFPGMQETQAPIIFNPSSFTQPFSGPSMDPISSEFALSAASQVNSGTSSVSLGHGSRGEMPLVESHNTSQRNSHIPRRINRVEFSTGMTQSPVLYATTSIPSIPTIPSIPLEMPNMETYSPLVLTTTAEAFNGPVSSTTNTTFTNHNSSSGFNIEGILMKVTSRTNPETDLGSVDMSCAFVVCDATMPDNPIIYASEIFSRLTGYNKNEVWMKNCRFLQSPDGKSKKGQKRKYVDDAAVYALKRGVLKRREVQCSLINYRKGGQPFTNLLTMVPITWDTEEVKYYVGFQIDLVDNPSAIISKSTTGTYSVNYSQHHLPPYTPRPPLPTPPHLDTTVTLSPGEVSTLLTSYQAGLNYDRTGLRDTLLLENSPDVIHILSPTGHFLYVSPSSQRILGYAPEELVGTALSTICHPSDIVSVMRDLKDASSSTGGGSITSIFRIRHATRGYIWFETHGRLRPSSTPSNSTLKTLLITSRERPIYSLPHTTLSLSAPTDSDIWSKLSTSGLILYISASVRTLLDRSPVSLVGTSFQALLPGEQRE